jgi:diguanylate cyclase
LRPTDVLARYGGEEFVIILPETGLEEGKRVMARVQRELTKNFFLHNNERVLITFSAGVAERLAEEAPDATMKRADMALYEAKHSGRNRVVGV